MVVSKQHLGWAGRTHVLSASRTAHHLAERRPAFAPYSPSPSLAQFTPIALAETPCRVRALAHLQSPRQVRAPPPRVQVNPLAETPEGALLAADAKLGFDDNAAYRQKEIFALRDESQEDPR